MTTVLSLPVRAYALAFFIISLGLLSFLPLSARAAQEDEPVCMMIVATPRTTTVHQGEKAFGIAAGERVIVGWVSARGEEREGPNGEIERVGLEIVNPTEDTTLSYRFENDEGSVTCTATLSVPDGKIEDPDELPEGGTLSIASIPLLTGGTATADTSVPVAYIKVSNGGTAPAAIEGFTLVENGSADEEDVIGFSTSDDKGGSRSTIGGKEGYEAFDEDGEAFIPLAATVAPKQVRIFTIKAALSKDLDPGDQLKLDVASVKSTATLKGSFPIRGTVWTFAR
jgi:hypothetical protein